jgi:sensor histidine kinase YesM
VRQALFVEDHMYKFIFKKLIDFICNEKERIKNAFHSFKYAFLIRLVISLILFLSLFLWGNSYYTTLARRQTYENIKSILELYNDNTAQNLDNMITYLIENTYLNADISSLNASNDLNDTYVSISRIKVQLSYSLNSFSQIGGIFFYSPKKDIFIQQSNNSHEIQMNNQKCADYISNTLRTCNSSRTLKNLDTTKWQMIELNQSYYIIRFFKINDFYVGAWANVDIIFSSFKYIKALESSILYVDESGHVLNDTKFSAYTFFPQNSLNNSSVFIDHYGIKYITISQKLKYCDYYIMALIPYKNITKILSPLYSTFVITVFIFAAITLSIILTANKLFNALTGYLKSVFRSIRNKEFNAKISSASQFSEIQDIICTFNDMITEIQNLRINVYEEKIIKNEIELQYLKSQVSPHFLINCLNTIFVLSKDEANQDVMLKIIQTLSDHLRYKLSNSTTTSLKDELHFVENYISLIQLRFPNCVTYDFNISPETEDASVFPLLLLMLTENSINLNLIMGESLSIYIKAYCYESNDVKRIHLQHIDSGSGFDESKLDIFNHINQHPELRKDGHHIGIFNTAMRLKLLLGDTANIYFSNEPGLGARIDIDFPYIVYTSDQIKE